MVRSRGIAAAAGYAAGQAVLELYWYPPDMSSCGRATSYADLLPEYIESNLGEGNICFLQVAL